MFNLSEIEAKEILQLPKPFKTDRQIDIQTNKRKDIQNYGADYRALILWQCLTQPTMDQ